MPGLNQLWKANKRLLQLQDGAKWLSVPGVQSDDFSAGASDSENQETYDGTTTETQNPAPGTWSFTALWAPTRKVMKRLRALYATSGSGRGTFRVLTKGSGTIYAASGNSTVAWTAQGVITFAGDSVPDFSTDEFKSGYVIEVGGKKIQIEEISDDGATVTGEGVNDEALAVQAATQAFKIVHPNLIEGPFSASVSEYGSQSAAAGGTVTTTIGLQPNGVLADVEVFEGVYPTQ